MTKYSLVPSLKGDIELENVKITGQLNYPKFLGDTFKSNKTGLTVGENHSETYQFKDYAVYLVAVQIKPNYNATLIASRTFIVTDLYSTKNVTPLTDVVYPPNILSSKSIEITLNASNLEFTVTSDVNHAILTYTVTAFKIG